VGEILFKHELYKMFFNKFSAAFIAIIFLVNIVQLVWQEENKYYYSTTSYNEMWSDMKESAGNSVAGWQAVLDKIVSEHQLMLEVDFEDSASFNTRYTDNLYFETALYARVIEEIEATLGYNDYLDGIEAAKHRFEVMGDFIEKDNFIYRNLVKTAKLYEGMTDMTLVPEASAGVKMATTSEITDFLVLALLMFLSVNMWLKEKEQGMVNLIRTARNGRVKLVASKFGVLAVACTVCGTIIYLSDIVVAGTVYGLGDLTRPIMTIDTYMGALWRVSVGEFLVLNLIARIVVYIWLAFLMSVICVVVSGSVAAFGSITFLFVGSYVLYTTVPTLSAFAVFKYLNPFGMLQTELLFQGYVGLNIGGYSFDYAKCMAVLLVMGFVVFALITTRLFIRHQVGNISHIYMLSEKAQKLFIKVRRRFEMHVSVLGHELYRIFIAGVILVVVIVAAVFQISSHKPYNISYRNAAEYYERQYLEELSGPVTEAKKAYIASEAERFRVPADEAEQGRKEALEKVAERLTYLESNEGTYFIYDASFDELTKGDWWNEDFKLAVFLLLLLAFAMPTFFAPEWQSGMYRIVSATGRGKHRLVRIRYITGIVLTLVFMVIAYLPSFLQVVISYEIKPETFSYPAGSLMHLAKFGTMINIGTYLVIVYVLRFLGGIFAALFIYRISAIIKNRIYTMVTAFVVLLIPTVMASVDKALDFVMYPYSMLAGNLFMQNGVAAAMCMAVIFAVTELIFLAEKRRKV